MPRSLRPVIIVCHFGVLDAFWKTTAKAMKFPLDKLAEGAKTMVKTI